MVICRIQQKTDMLFWCEAHQESSTFFLLRVGIFSFIFQLLEDDWLACSLALERTLEVGFNFQELR